MVAAEDASCVLIQGEADVLVQRGRGEESLCLRIHWDRH